MWAPARARTATSASLRARAISPGSRPSPRSRRGRASGGPARSSSALGVDAAAGDPESPLAVTADGYAAAGRELGGLTLPTVLVQEGGYDLEAIGELVVATLTGLEHALGAGR